MATARPGVLVRAPAIRPTMLGVSMPKAYLKMIPVMLAEPTMRSARMMSVFPFERKESKKPGPAWIPMVKIKSTRPISPKALGMVTPKCPNSKAMKMTADTSSDRPLILIRPRINPSEMIRNKAK